MKINILQLLVKFFKHENLWDLGLKNRWKKIFQKKFENNVELCFKSNEWFNSLKNIIIMLNIFK